MVSLLFVSFHPRFSFYSHRFYFFFYQGLRPGNESFQVETVKRIANVSNAINFLRTLETLNRWSRKFIVLDCPTEMAKEIIINHVRDISLGRRTYHYLLSGLVSIRFWLPHSILCTVSTSTYFTFPTLSLSISHSALFTSLSVHFPIFLRLFFVPFRLLFFHSPLPHFIPFSHFVIYISKYSTNSVLCVCMYVCVSAYMIFIRRAIKMHRLHRHFWVDRGQ